jgi:hypothetical protein
VSQFKHTWENVNQFFHIVKIVFKLEQRSYLQYINFLFPFSYHSFLQWDTRVLDFPLVTAIEKIIKNE